MFANLLQLTHLDARIGSGYFDMTFIDHSDNFQECHRPLGSDIRNTQGSFMGSNQSLCEELQFQGQVLQPEWSWGGAKFMDLYIFNVTNPGPATSGQTLKVEELAPMFLSSRNIDGEPAGVVTVNRDDLDTEGRLTYKVLRHWRYRAELRKQQRTSFSQEITVPHYVFAAALHNGLPTSDMISASSRAAFTNLGLESYYPLFVKVKIGELIGAETSRAQDPVADSAVDTPFTLDMLEQNPTSTSYFVSQRYGLQGFGFVRYAWDGTDVHCGYDTDCADGASLALRNTTFQLSKEKALETSRSCTSSDSCKPTSLKHANNGVEFGVSAFKHFPSGSFNQIPEVTGELWNYKDYVKEGTTWTGLNNEYFVLYDVKLSKETRFMRVPTHQWSLSKFHRRTENCEGGGGDSKGFDCSSPQSTVFIGSARDALRPGPLYLAQADSRASDEAGVDIVSCEGANHDLLECRRPLKNDLQILTDSLFGFRVCDRQSSQISLKLQKNTAFANQDPLVPFAWKKVHFCLTGGKMFELMRIYITNARITPAIGFIVVYFLISLSGLVIAARAFSTIRRVNTIATHLGEKPCV